MKWITETKVILLIVAIVTSLSILLFYPVYKPQEVPKADLKALDEPDEDLVDPFIYYYYNLSNPNQTFKADEQGNFVEVNPDGR